MFTLARNTDLYNELCKKYPDCPDVWKYFVSLTEVPRPSHHTELASKWAQEKGKELGGTVKVDAVGNVAISFPASAGKESCPAVVLQAHLDMVPTKTPDQVHDFTKDPILARLDGDLLRATNTTLGGDDGSGVAAALAIAADKTLVRGPLEILFTIDEETGLVGASNLKEGELLSSNAKYLINIDSEDWGEICLSCAGGVGRELHIPVHRAELPADWEVYNFEYKDFKGGHSGVEIQACRANALKCVVETFANNDVAIAGAEYRIVQLHAGNAHNAIPSLATVEVAFPKDVAAKFIVAVREKFAQILTRYAGIEVTPLKAPQLVVTKLARASAANALTFSSTRTALRFFESIHHGVFAWSEEIPDLVETSQSLSVIHIPLEGTLSAEVFARSSKNESLTALSNYLAATAALYGGESVVKMADSPGWPAEPESTLCKASVEVYKDLFKEEPKLTSIHAGLECGIIMNKYPKNGMEAISLGPTVKNPHTPDEYIDMNTWVKVYKFVHGIVAKLAN